MLCQFAAFLKINHGAYQQCNNANSSKYLNQNKNSKATCFLRSRSFRRKYGVMYTLSKRMSVRYL